MTVDADTNYQESAKSIAISIYKDYLNQNAIYFVDIDS
jgi:hypothetical protein